MVTSTATAGRSKEPQDATASPALTSAGNFCLFIDVDGTLLDFALTPDGVCVDQELVELLAAAAHATQGGLALVSGRSIAELDRLFAPLHLPIAGIHGYERRDAAGTIHRRSTQDERLPAARAALQEFVRAHYGLLLEDKQWALAVHYRLAPQLEALVKATLTRLLLALAPDYDLLEGDAVLEIKPASHTKATAVEAFLREPPFAGRVPVFFGDDLTDCDGFVAVRRHRGMSIAVGDRVAAQYRLPDPAAMRAWLKSYVQRPDPPT